MRLSVQQRLDFLSEHFIVDGTTPFVVKPWFKNELYIPFSGFRIVARDVDRLCDACKPRAGSIVEIWDWSMVDAFDVHASKEQDECGGLALIPIIFSVITVPRQQGKTTAVLGLALSILVGEHGKEVLYTASNEDQAGAIIDKKLRAPIDASPLLSKMLHSVGSEVRCKSTGSFLRVLNSSFRGATGLSFGALLIDEARDVHPRTFAAMAPTMLSRGGETCPRHPKVRHGRTPDGKPGKCPHCGERLTPWWPRAVLFSSLGILEGTERDWFAELIATLEEHPELEQHFHLFSTDEAGQFSREHNDTRKALDVFLHVPTLAPYFEAELTNRPRRMGESYVTAAQIASVTDRSHLGDAIGSEAPCVSWLDASWSHDLTSWVVLEDARIDGQTPWETIRVARIEAWHPKQLPGGVIDPTMIQASFDEAMPLFPGMRVAMIDTRGMVWAKDFALYQQRERPAWGKRVAMLHRKHEPDGKKTGARFEDVSGSKDDRRRSYELLEMRVAGGKIILPAGKWGAQIKAELLGAVRTFDKDGIEEIRDKSRKKSHLDIVDAIAGACLLVFREQTRPLRRSLKDVYGTAAKDAPDLLRAIGLTSGFRTNRF